MSCEKVSYQTYKLAKDSADAISSRDKVSMSTYKCPECNWFHLTSVKKSKPEYNKTKIKFIKPSPSTMSMLKLDNEIKEAAKNIPILSKIMDYSKLPPSTPPKFKLKDIARTKEIKQDPEPVEVKFSQEAIDFATWFSNDYFTLKADNYPSDKGSYMLSLFYYIPTITDDDTKTLPYTVGRSMNSNGTIMLQVAQSQIRFNIDFKSKDFLYFLILWLIAAPTLSPSETDRVAFMHCIENGKSKDDLLVGFLSMIELNPTEQNIQRFEAIDKLLNGNNEAEN